MINIFLQCDAFPILQTNPRIMSACSGEVLSLSEFPDEGTALIMARIGMFDLQDITATMICNHHYNILYRNFRNNFVWAKKCLWIHHERRFKRTLDSGEPGHKIKKPGPKPKAQRLFKLNKSFAQIDVKKSKKLWKNYEILVPRDGFACNSCMREIYAMLRNVKDDDENAKQVSHKNLKQAVVTKSSKKVII